MLRQGPKAVLGPGTGLGQAQVLWDEGLGGYRVWPSEGSHATFAPRGWKQRALQARPPPPGLSGRIGYPTLPCSHPTRTQFEMFTLYM